jgi:dihydroorotate dehydrogenase electron transfer subunit
MPVNKKCEIVKKEFLLDNICSMTIVAPEIAKEAKPGQFLNIRVIDNIEPLLRRPISIYNADKEKGEVTFIFQLKGKGTNILANRKEGELLDIMGPLGYGTFKFEGYKNIAIIGGGIGIFPLHELSKRAKEAGVNTKIYIGFRNKDLVILEDEFKSVCNEFVLATDDGSYGKNGFAINFLKDDIETNKPDCIYACGPLPMLKAVQSYANENNIPCQISLEERMACGMGVCLGCAVKDAKQENTYKHVCKNGPVFDSRDVEI